MLLFAGMSRKLIEYVKKNGETDIETVERASVTDGPEQGISEI